MRFRRQAGRESGAPLAPLLDVVLLLLIFFVVTSSFAERQLPLELPEAESGERIEEETLVISLDAAGQISVDERQLEDEAALVARLEETAANGASVELRADRATDHGAVVRVLDAASRAGVSAIGIAVSPAHATPSVPD